MRVCVTISGADYKSSKMRSENWLLYLAKQKTLAVLLRAITWAKIYLTCELIIVV